MLIVTKNIEKATLLYIKIITRLHHHILNSINQKYYIYILFESFFFFKTKGKSRLSELKYDYLYQKIRNFLSGSFKSLYQSVTKDRLNYNNLLTRTIN